jgi:serine/threonine-protein kinase HipA
MTTDPFRVFMDLHLRLPRQGPGSKEDTAKALSLLGPLPPTPSILDMGCGAGAQTFDLLELTDARLTAVDLMQPALKKLTDRAEAKDIPQERLALVCGDMENLDLEGETFDGIWSEGAIYSIGFANGLKLWRQHLKPGGLIVVSEVTWLTETPHPKAKLFWQEGYPAMENIHGNIKRGTEQGYEFLGHHTISEQTWWDSYYTPKEQAVKEMKKEFPTSDLSAQRVLAEAAAEVALFRNHGQDYSYVFYTFRKLTGH